MTPEKKNNTKKRRLATKCQQHPITPSPKKEKKKKQKKQKQKQTQKKEKEKKRLPPKYQQHLVVPSYNLSDNNSKKRMRTGGIPNVVSPTSTSSLETTIAATEEDGPWTEHEHWCFLSGLDACGGHHDSPNDGALFLRIAKMYVPTRSAVQCQLHFERESPHW